MTNPFGVKDNMKHIFNPSLIYQGWITRYTQCYLEMCHCGCKNNVSSNDMLRYAMSVVLNTCWHLVDFFIYIYLYIYVQNYY